MRTTQLTLGALAATATYALTGLGIASPATAATTTHEVGNVIECTGTIKGRAVYASLYENNHYGNQIQVVIGDGDGQVGNARKAAKRLRYVVEALVPVWGDDARNLAQAAKRMSSMLGDRQDSVVARHDLLELAAMATAAGENGFTYGRLHAREEAHARRLDHDFDVLWSDILARKRLRAWLR